MRKKKYAHFTGDSPLGRVIQEHIVDAPATKGEALDIIGYLLEGWSLNENEIYAVRYVLSSIRFEYVLVIGQVLMNVTEQALKYVPKESLEPETILLVVCKEHSVSLTTWPDVMSHLESVHGLSFWDWFTDDAVTQAIKVFTVRVIDLYIEWRKSTTGKS